MATQTQKVREYYMARRAQKAGKSATSAGSGRRNIFAPPTVGRNIISQRSRRISESRAPPPKPQETAEQKATRYGIESRQEQIQGYRNILDRPTTDAEHRAMARREIANLSAMSDAEFAQMRVSAHEKYQEYRSHMHSSYDSDGTLSINGQRQSMDGKPVTKENISEFIAEQKKTLPGKDYIRIYPTGKDAMTKEGWDKAKAQEYAINLKAYNDKVKEFNAANLKEEFYATEQRRAAKLGVEPPTREQFESGEYELTEKPKISEDVEYTRTGAGEPTLDMYVPKGTTSAAGNAFIFGDSENQDPRLASTILGKRSLQSMIFGERFSDMLYTNQPVSVPPTENEEFYSRWKEISFEQSPQDWEEVKSEKSEDVDYYSRLEGATILEKIDDEGNSRFYVNKRAGKLRIAESLTAQGLTPFESVSMAEFYTKPEKQSFTLLDTKGKLTTYDTADVIKVPISILGVPTTLSVPGKSIVTIGGLASSQFSLEKLGGIADVGLGITLGPGAGEKLSKNIPMLGFGTLKAPGITTKTVADIIGVPTMQPQMSMIPAAPAVEEKIDSRISVEDLQYSSAVKMMSESAGEVASLTKKGYFGEKGKDIFSNYMPEDFAGSVAARHMVFAGGVTVMGAIGESAMVGGVGKTISRWVGLPIAAVSGYEFLEARKSYEEAPSAAAIGSQWTSGVGVVTGGLMMKEFGIPTPLKYKAKTVYLEAPGSYEKWSDMPKVVQWKGIEGNFKFRAPFGRGKIFDLTGKPIIGQTLEQRMLTTSGSTRARMTVENYAKYLVKTGKVPFIGYIEDLPKSMRAEGAKVLGDSLGMTVRTKPGEHMWGGKDVILLNKKLLAKEPAIVKRYTIAHEITHTLQPLWFRKLSWKIPYSVEAVDHPFIFTTLTKKPLGIDTIKLIVDTKSGSIGIASRPSEILAFWKEEAPMFNVRIPSGTGKKAGMIYKWGIGWPKELTYPFKPIHGMPETYSDVLWFKRYDVPYIREKLPAILTEQKYPGTFIKHKTGEFLEWRFPVNRKVDNYMTQMEGRYKFMAEAFEAGFKVKKFAHLESGFIKQPDYKLFEHVEALQGQPPEAIKAFIGKLKLEKWMESYYIAGSSTIKPQLGDIFFPRTSGDIDIRYLTARAAPKAEMFKNILEAHGAKVRLDEGYRTQGEATRIYKGDFMKSLLKGIKPKDVVKKGETLMTIVEIKTPKISLTRTKGGLVKKYEEEWVKLLDIHGTDTPAEVAEFVYGFGTEPPVSIRAGAGDKGTMPSQTISRTQTEKFGATFGFHGKEGFGFETPEDIKHGVDLFNIGRGLIFSKASRLSEVKFGLPETSGVRGSFKVEGVQNALKANIKYEKMMRNVYGEKWSEQMSKPPSEMRLIPMSPKPVSKFFKYAWKAPYVSSVSPYSKFSPSMFSPSSESASSKSKSSVSPSSVSPSSESPSSESPSSVSPSSTSPSSKSPSSVSPSASSSSTSSSSVSEVYRYKIPSPSVMLGFGMRKRRGEPIKARPDKIYKTETKERGKWRTLATGMSESEAKDIGAQYVDVTPAVRFRIRESKGARSQVDVPLGYFAKHRQKFRGYEKGKGPLKQEFIEERKFRIDMPGEHVGITKKGWVAPRLPRGSRFGAGIRFKKFKIF